MSRPRLPWLPFLHPVTGEEWLVALTSLRDINAVCREDGATYEKPACAVTSFQRRLVLIHERQSRAKVLECLAHELAHVAAGNGDCEEFIERIDGPLSRLWAAIGITVPPIPKRHRRERVTPCE